MGATGFDARGADSAHVGSPVQGVNVRERARKVSVLLSDDARLRAERETQRKQYWCVRHSVDAPRRCR